MKVVFNPITGKFILTDPLESLSIMNGDIPFPISSGSVPSITYNAFGSLYDSRSLQRPVMWDDTGAITVYPQFPAGLVPRSVLVSSTGDVYSVASAIAASGQYSGANIIKNGEFYLRDTSNNFISFDGNVGSTQHTACIDSSNNIYMVTTASNSTSGNISKNGTNLYTMSSRCPKAVCVSAAGDVYVACWGNSGAATAYVYKNNSVLYTFSTTDISQFRLAGIAYNEVDGHVYVVGKYLKISDNSVHPCVWVDGVASDLDLVVDGNTYTNGDASCIAIDGAGSVYIGGVVTMNTNTVLNYSTLTAKGAVLWIDGTPSFLDYDVYDVTSDTASVKALSFDGTDMYAFGTLGTATPTTAMVTWKNGTLHSTLSATGLTSGYGPTGMFAHSGTPYCLVDNSFNRTLQMYVYSAPSTKTLQNPEGQGGTILAAAITNHTYAVGQYIVNGGMGHKGLVWKDAVLQTMDNTGFSSGNFQIQMEFVAADNTDYYAQGYFYNTSTGATSHLIWKNGTIVGTRLEAHTFSPTLDANSQTVTDFTVHSGTPYLIGYGYNTGLDAEIPFTYSGSSSANLDISLTDHGVDAISIYSNGTHLYAAGVGYDTDWNDTPVLWTDGVQSILDKGSNNFGDAYFVTESGGHVYVAGGVYDINYNQFPCIWIDGVLTELDTGAGTNGFTEAIIIKGSTVIAVGYVDSNPAVWIDGTLSLINLGSYSSLYGWPVNNSWGEPTGKYVVSATSSDFAIVGIGNNAGTHNPLIWINDVASAPTELDRTGYSGTQHQVNTVILT